MTVQILIDDVLDTGDGTQPTGFTMPWVEALLAANTGPTAECFSILDEFSLADDSSDGPIGTYALRSDFAAYSAATMAFTLEFYYHLDDGAPTTQPIDLPVLFIPHKTRLTPKTLPQVEANWRTIEIWAQQVRDDIFTVSSGGGTVGPAGPPGPTGSTGATGAAGSTGATGPTGPAGATGADGSDGIDGIDGAQGPAGTFGTNSIVFGDGSDGNVNFDGTTTVLGIVPSSNIYTLTRNVYCNVATFSGSFAGIKTNNFKFWALEIDATVSGFISNDGNAAVTVTGGTATSAQVYAITTTGGSGVAGTLGNAGGLVPNNGLGGAGGDGGIASGSGTGGGVAGGAVTAITAARGGPGIHTYTEAVMGWTDGASVQSQAGGAGGSAGTAATGTGVGGGGGAGGGICLVVCGSIVVTTSATLTVRSLGGAGGQGTAGSSTNVGGGGGGGGGAVIVVYGRISGGGTFATSAAGGAGGARRGTGATGATGSSGKVYQFQL